MYERGANWMYLTGGRGSVEQQRREKRKGGWRIFRGGGNEQVHIRMVEHSQGYHIHGCRNDNNPRVEVVQPPVLCESLGDEPSAHEVEEEEVESQVDDEKETLLSVFPCKVDPLLRWCPVHGGGYPDDGHRDVDAADDAEEGPAEDSCLAARCHDERDTVDDDLGQELSLDRPQDDCQGLTIGGLMDKSCLLVPM